MPTIRLRQMARAIPGYALMSLVKNVLAGGDDRRTALLRWKSPIGLLQPSGHTQFDRYPDIFSRLMQSVGKHETPKVLSFGCSVGDEILTVLRYFPTAIVRGIDIDPARIADCVKRFDDEPNVSFTRASSAQDEPENEYDIVLAMAVLRHGDLDGRHEHSANYFTFAQFGAALRPLLKALKPGGVLAARHANFRILDAADSVTVEPLWSLPASGPIYDRYNRITHDECEFVIFRKRCAGE